MNISINRNIREASGKVPKEYLTGLVDVRPDQQLNFA